MTTPVPPQPGAAPAANSYNWGDLIKIAGEANIPVLLPVGEYEFSIEEASHVQASNGKDMIKIRTVVSSGPDQGKRGPWHNFVLSPESSNAMGFFFQHMEALGISREYLQSSGIHPAQLAPYLVNRRFRGRIRHRDYQGNPQMELAAIMPAQAVAPLPTGTTSGLDVFKPHQPTAPAASAPAAAAPAPPLPSPAPAAPPLPSPAPAAPPLPSPAPAAPSPGSPPPPPATPF